MLSSSLLHFSARVNSTIQLQNCRPPLGAGDVYPTGSGSWMNQTAEEIPAPLSARKDVLRCGMIAKSLRDDMAGSYQLPFDDPLAD